MSHLVRTRALMILLLVLAAEAGTARAQAPGLTPAAIQVEAETVEVRYGWQILLADLAAVLAGAATEEGGVTVGMYLGGGPVIHLAHGNSGGALASLAMRAGLPFVGAMLGYSIEASTCEDEFLCGLGGVLIGGAIGVLTASVVDAAVVAKKRRRVERPRGVLQLGGISATPTAAPIADRGLSFGLVGSF